MWVITCYPDNNNESFQIHNCGIANVQFKDGLILLKVFMEEL